MELLSTVGSCSSCLFSHAVLSLSLSLSPTLSHPRHVLPFSLSLTFLLSHVLSGFPHSSMIKALQPVSWTVLSIQPFSCQICSRKSITNLTSRWDNIAFSVCMTTKILETIKAKTTKFKDNVFYYYTQIKNVLEFGYALFRLLKLKKLRQEGILSMWQSKMFVLDREGPFCSH